MADMNGHPMYVTVTIDHVHLIRASVALASPELILIGSKVLILHPC